MFQEAPDPLTKIRLNGTSYMLLEFPFQAVPPNIEMTIFQILNAGITPVIAHPERNMRIQERPEILADLVRAGRVRAARCRESDKRVSGRSHTQTAKRMVEAGAGPLHCDRRAPRGSAATDSLDGGGGGGRDWRGSSMRGRWCWPIRRR
jgi:hypothetical protein